jgi:hypothetical protein
MTDEELLQQFEDCTLPFDQWVHRTHLKVAYLCLTRYPFERAVEKMRSGIRAYNAAHQVPDEPTRGYHETMTMAWLRIIHAMLRVNGPADSADEFVSGQPQLWEKKNLRFFYSPELMMSPQAKREFVEPDLAPLPCPNDECPPKHYLDTQR